MNGEMSGSRLPAEPAAAVSTPERARLAAVAHLLRAERRHRWWDIVLATVFDALSAGPKATWEVTSAVRQRWPGIQLSDASIELALDQALERGLVVRDATLHEGLWSTSSLVEAERSSSRSYSDGLLRDASAELMASARRELGRVIDSQTADTWTSILLASLDAALVPLMRTGSTTNTMDRFLAPIAPDLDALAACVTERCLDPDVRKFLQAKAMTALDPSNLFWSDIVHHLCVGYLLFRHAGRIDDATALHGSWSGETVFLDTPILLQLLGVHRHTSPVWDLLGRITQLGVRVVVLSCTVDELRANLALAGADESLIRADHDAGVAAANMMQSLQGAHRAWVSFAVDDGVLPTWNDFESRCEQKIGQLSAIGVEIRPHVLDIADSARIAAIQQKLKVALSARNRFRGERAQRHDSYLLNELEVARQQAPATQSKPWPGGVIATSDTFLNETYRAVNGTDSRFPVVMSLGHIATLAAESAEPAEAEEVIRAASRDLASGALLAMAPSLPVELALQLASSSKSPLDVQMTLDDLIAGATDLNDPKQVQLDVHAALTRRAQSHQRASEEQAERLNSRRSRMDRDNEIEHALYQQQTKTNSELEARLVSATGRVSL
jgi:hypothetical protein